MNSDGLFYKFGEKAVSQAIWDNFLFLKQPGRCLSEQKSYLRTFRFSFSRFLTDSLAYLWV